MDEQVEPAELGGGALDQRARLVRAGEVAVGAAGAETAQPSSLSRSAISGADPAGAAGDERTHAAVRP